MSHFKSLNRRREGFGECGGERVHCLRDFVQGSTGDRDFFRERSIMVDDSGNISFQAMVGYVQFAGSARFFHFISYAGIIDFGDNPLADPLSIHSVADQFYRSRKLVSANQGKGNRVVARKESEVGPAYPCCFNSDDGFICVWG